MADPLLGYIWRENEVDWEGVWNRKSGDTNEFHAHFKHLPTGKEIEGELTMERNGQDIRIHRWNANAPGRCEYHGTFSGDFKTAAGGYYCFDEHANRVPREGEFGWHATIS
jgi:hypothetical protein